MPPTNRTEGAHGVLVSEEQEARAGHPPEREQERARAERRRARRSREREHEGRDLCLGWACQPHYRKRLPKGEAGGDQELSPEVEKQQRNLEFGAYLVEKAKRQGLAGPGDVISDELIAEAAGEFFGDATSPEARAAIAYVNDAD
jgi:hypothetical protein